MKGSCANCHRLTCNTGSIAAKSLLIELRCLEAGKIATAVEIAESMENVDGERWAEDVKVRRLLTLISGLKSSLKRDTREPDFINKVFYLKS